MQSAAGAGGSWKDSSPKEKSGGFATEFYFFRGVCSSELVLSCSFQNVAWTEEGWEQRTVWVRKLRGKARGLFISRELVFLDAQTDTKSGMH